MDDVEFAVDLVKRMVLRIQQVVREEANMALSKNCSLDQ